MNCCLQNVSRQLQCVVSHRPSLYELNSQQVENQAGEGHDLQCACLCQQSQELCIALQS